MSVNVTECDNCRKIGPLPAWGWVAVIIQQRQEEPSFLAMLGGGNGGAELAGTFCSWPCVAQYAAARALIGEAQGADGG